MKKFNYAGGVFVYFPITESIGIQQELLYAMKGSRQNVTITMPVNINTLGLYICCWHVFLKAHVRLYNYMKVIEVSLVTGIYEK